ncbi:MAG: hypothetical protein HYX63_07805 [Gammaproteobacteria bacterium]|nr:hypothetical protein [Gammaproteobacteria bacterium]
MTRLSIVLLLSALSAPLAAHEGLELDSPLHNFLHSFGTDNAIGVCAIGLIIGVGVLFRRRMRARAISQTRLAR